MSRPSPLVLFALLTCGTALAAPPAIPLRADAPPRFVPEGWRLETQLEADFNADGKTDIAMVVRNDDERWLLVALGEGKGLRRIGLGALDPYPLGDASLEAKKGVLLITDLIGGTTAIQSTYRYRFEKASGRMQLIGDDVELYSRTNAHGGISVSTNRLNGKRITQSSTIDEPDGERRFSREVVSKVPSTPIYLEDAPAPEDTVSVGEEK
jgi:hypothetical protein